MICYEEPIRVYRLQNCGHRFCFECLGQYVNSALGDISMFPIKCPHCLVEVTVDDLESLVDEASWPKLITMSVNQFVNKNAESLTFCYTPGCQQINFLNLKTFCCDECGITYCINCKQK